MKKFDVTTSHCYTQHWEVMAKDKETKVVESAEMKFTEDELQSLQDFLQPCTYQYQF